MATNRLLMINSAELEQRIKKSKYFFKKKHNKQNIEQQVCNKLKSQVKKYLLVNFTIILLSVLTDNNLVRDWLGRYHSAFGYLVVHPVWGELG